MRRYRGKCAVWRRDNIHVTSIWEEETHCMEDNKYTK